MKFGFLPLRTVKSPRCPVCGQGEVDCYTNKKSRDYLFICNECDSVWHSYLEIFTQNIKDTVRIDQSIFDTDEHSLILDAYVLFSDIKISKLLNNLSNLQFVSQKFNNCFFYVQVFPEETDIFKSKALLFEFNKSTSSVFVCGYPFNALEKDRMPFFIFGEMS